jgi:hypothetical protein
MPSALTFAITPNAAQGWTKKYAKCTGICYYAQYSTGLMKPNEDIHINLYTVKKTRVHVFLCIPDEGVHVQVGFDDEECALGFLLSHVTWSRAIRGLLTNHYHIRTINECTKKGR